MTQYVKIVFFVIVVLVLWSGLRIYFQVDKNKYSIVSDIECNETIVNKTSNAIQNYWDMRQNDIEVMMLLGEYVQLRCTIDKFMDGNKTEDILDFEKDINTIVGRIQNNNDVKGIILIVDEIFVNNHGDLISYVVNGIDGYVNIGGGTMEYLNVTRIHKMLLLISIETKDCDLVGKEIKYLKLSPEYMGNMTAENKFVKKMIKNKLNMKYLIRNNLYYKILC